MSTLPAGVYVVACGHCQLRVPYLRHHDDPDLLITNPELEHHDRDFHRLVLDVLTDPA